MNNETVTITHKEYEELLEDSRWVEDLESAGVDNWGGIDYAFELRRERRNAEE